MKITLLLLTMAATATAQSNSGKLLEQGLRSAFAAFEPIPKEDQAQILRTTTELLSKHVTFRPDNTASAVCLPNGKQHVEWKGLAVNRVTKQALNSADTLNGISKRYLVSFTCQGHRSWDSKTNAWGPWHPIGHVLFPSAIRVEWKNGACVSVESEQLRWFSPGPGAATVSSQPAATPAAKSDGLPPGMTRARP